jgi:hypothetical protein
MWRFRAIGVLERRDNRVVSPPTGRHPKLQTTLGRSSDNQNMVIALASSAAKAAGAWARRFGLAQVADGWEERAAICERCPMRVVRCGISYCGKPLLAQIDRNPAVDGCGCPCREKSKAPGEHCPLDQHHRPAATDDGGCNCKWCRNILTRR